VPLPAPWRRLRARRLRAVAIARAGVRLAAGRLVWLPLVERLSLVLARTWLAVLWLPLRVRLLAVLRLTLRVRRLAV